jgi:hypothetical protein
MFKALKILASVNVGILGPKLISIGVDGNNVFQDSRIGVIIQMKETIVPFFMGVHCFVHRINLDVLMLSKLNLVDKLGALLQAMYAFFSHSPKKYLEFQKLCEVPWKNEASCFKV